MSVRLAIVTPLGNEADSVTALMREVAGRMRPDDRWFGVLDKVSRDDTRALVAAHARRDRRFAEVWAPENRCVVDAYFAGYRAALASGARWILEMDAGFSHPPEKIPDFVAAMEAGYEFAGGTRFAPGGGHDSPITRRVLSYGGTVMARVFLGSRMSDMTGGYECFARHALEHVVARGVRSRANFFQTEIRHMMHAFRWTEVPFVYVNDQPKVGRSAVRESLRILFELARSR
jgi:dolichol-phosphate mannosyltransferase